MKLSAQEPPPRQALAWLYTVVRRAALDAARSERRRRAHEGRAATPNWFLPAEPDGLDAEAAAAALATLPADQREIVVAHLWGGLTFEEVGELTGSSAATAYRRYTAGLAALRDKLRVPCPTPNRPATLN